MTYPYPFDNPIWNVSDQLYFCKMVNKYRFPVDRCPAIYQVIIKEGRSDTFEAEYEQYKADLLAQQQQASQPQQQEPQQEEVTQEVTEPQPTEE